MAALALPAGGATITGPNTTTAPYVLPVASGVDITSLLTVSDAGAADNGFEMVGIPDGLGARRSPSGGVEVFNNQELVATAGVVRAHGQKGAFVTRYTIDPATNAVKAGADLIQPGIQYYDYVTGNYAAAPNAAGTNPSTGKSFPAYNPAFARFCSSSLTDPYQLLNFATGRGHVGQIYFANEENGNEGRVLGVTTEGEAQELPRLGLASWENTNVARTRSDTTTVIGDEDGADGQIWVYTGTKQYRGSAFDKAGLTNGTSHVVRVGGGPLADPAVRAAIAASPNKKVAFDLVDVDWNQSGADQNAEAKGKGMSLNRIEDGAWDPKDKNVFYFVTTEGGVGATTARDGGGLWRLTFADVENPTAGGTLELLLNGAESIGLNKPDNITLDADGGHILIQEDPGNNAHVSRIVAYRIADGATAVVARFDPALFDPSSPTFLTQDEESSGIIDVTGLYVRPPTNTQEALEYLDNVLGRGKGGTFLFDAQVHTAAGLDNAAAQVERGQLLLLKIRDWRLVYGS